MIQLFMALMMVDLSHGHRHLGEEMGWVTLRILLPVGMSYPGLLLSMHAGT